MYEYRTAGVVRLSLKWASNGVLHYAPSAVLPTRHTMPPLGTTVTSCPPGRLIFQGNLILILLEGEGPALKDYLVRHRTENVDVDSHGRRCGVGVVA